MDDHIVLRGIVLLRKRRRKAIPFDALLGERTPSRIRSARRWTLERGPSCSASTLMSYPHRTLPSVSPEPLEGPDEDRPAKRRPRQTANVCQAAQCVMWMYPTLCGDPRWRSQRSSSMEAFETSSCLASHRILPTRRTCSLPRTTTFLREDDGDVTRSRSVCVAGQKSSSSAQAEAMFHNLRHVFLPEGPATTRQCEGCRSWKVPHLLRRMPLTSAVHTSR